MRMRGQARTPGRILKADVYRDVRGWQLSLVVETDCAERAPATGPAIGLDWGVAEFATIAREDADGPRFEAVPNPRHLDAEKAALIAQQRALSGLARARKISRGALRKQRSALARKHAKVAARRKDFLHQLTARIAGRHRLIVTEKLTVRNMTGSARGTLEAPGRNVAQKAGLNRSILDAAPAAFLNMLRYKAEEASYPVRVSAENAPVERFQEEKATAVANAEFLEADTRRLKPSQRCPDCGAVRKKALSIRQHDCDACGCSYGRDEAAALTLLRWGLGRSALVRGDLSGGQIEGQTGEVPGAEVAARERDADPAPPENGHPAGTVGASDPPLAA